ncbi:MAG: IS21 family transposase [Candidatus Krumholzibacteriia bacterium]
MANVLDNEKRQQILALGRLGWSLRRIEAETGVRRETASAYLKAAGIGVRSPGRWGRRPRKPAKETSTDPPRWPPPPGRSPQASACEPYRELIERARAQGRHAMAIWQDLVDDHAFPAGYASVQRFVKKLREVHEPEAHPVIVTAPGEEGQVDYGDGPMVRHPETGKYRRTRLFVFALGHSRKCVRFLVWKSSTQIWAELHEKAFRRLGGAPRVVVLDNLKEGVLTPDVYDPALNPLYRDVLAHYGVTALPCRVRHPDRKGKVESGIDHAQKKLKGLRFEGLDEAQVYLDRWEERWADTRIHGTTKRQVAVMFAEEKPHLLPLPLEPFRYYRFGERTVHLDGAVEVEGAYYHLPPGWIGRRVAVQWDVLRLRILDPRTGELLVEHVRQKRGGRRMREEHRPKKTPPSTQRLLLRAERAGRHLGAVCRAIHRQDGEAGVRRIQGVLSLAKKHGLAVVDEVCAEALAVELPSYRFVRRAVERRPSLPLTLKQVDPLIRELTHYRDLIDRRTQGDPT